MYLPLPPFPFLPPFPLPLSPLCFSPFDFPVLPRFLIGLITDRGGSMQKLRPFKYRTYASTQKSLAVLHRKVYAHKLAVAGNCYVQMDGRTVIWSTDTQGHCKVWDAEVPFSLFMFPFPVPHSLPFPSPFPFLPNRPCCLLKALIWA